MLSKNTNGLLQNEVQNIYRVSQTRNRNQIQPILTTINSNYMKITQSMHELLFIVIMKQMLLVS